MARRTRRVPVADNQAICLHLMENCQAVICAHDIEGKILFMSRGGAQLFRYQAEEMIGRNLSEFLVPQVRPLFQQYRERVRRNEKDSGLMRVLTKDHEELILLYRNSLYLEPGKDVCVVGYAQDVTGLKKAEWALRESEAKFRSIVETTHEWIWSVDLQGHHTYCNPAVEKILGYSPDQILGADSLLFVFEEDRNEFREILANAVAHQRGWAGKVIRWRHKYGGLRYLESNAVPAFDKNGNLAGFRGTDRDITERKIAEESLMALKKAVETMQLGVTITDTQAKIIYSNPAEAKLHGYEVGELVGQHSRIFSPPEHWKDMTDEEMRRTRSWGRESINVRKDGTRFPVRLLSDIVTNPSGHSISIVTSCEDITERKRGEERMLRFIAGVAHEVRNPLYAIQTGIQTLQLDFDKNSEYAPLLEVVYSQVERLSQLMKDLLELGRPRNSYRLQREDLPQLCRAAIHLWNQTHVFPHHTARLAEPVSMLPEVTVDGERIQQVLLNLLDNAAQHSPGGTEIQLSLLSCGESIILRITDQGRGIKAEDLPQIFDPFYTTRKGGTGLGLSLVKNIVEAHGGMVSLKNNEPPPGCTVELILPVSALGSTPDDAVVLR